MDGKKILRFGLLAKEADHIVVDNDLVLAEADLEVSA